MGVILDELLNSIPKSELDEQVKIICDKIMLEEKAKDKDYLPTGSNIFLAVQFNIFNSPSINFLCLEREMKEKYIVSHWRKDKMKRDVLLPIKRIETWEVKEDKTEKILKFYALKLKYLKGE